MITARASLTFALCNQGQGHGRRKLSPFTTIQTVSSDKCHLTHVQEHLTKVLYMHIQQPSVDDARHIQQLL